MRTESIGMRVQGLLDTGKIVLRQIDPAERTPGEFVSHGAAGRAGRRSARDPDRQFERLFAGDAGCKNS